MAFLHPSHYHGQGDRAANAGGAPHSDPRSHLVRGDAIAATLIALGEDPAGADAFRVSPPPPRYRGGHMAWAARPDHFDAPWAELFERGSVELVSQCERWRAGCTDTPHPEPMVDWRGKQHQARGILLDGALIANPRRRTRHLARSDRTTDRLACRNLLLNGAAKELFARLSA